MRVGSLFAGIGGIDLGLERAGFTTVWQVEINPFRRKVLELRFPHAKRFADVKEVNAGNVEAIDLLAGGFPCQDLSVAGKREGIEGSRSSLWFEFSRLIGELRPRYVLIENVSGLLVYGAMRRVIGELSKLGYVGIWRVLRASDFGASHQRKRVFIVAWNLAYSNQERCGETRGCIGEALADSTNSNLPRFTRRANEGTANEASRKDRSRSDETSAGCFLLENSGRSRERGSAESSELARGRSPGHDCGASGTLADTGSGQLPEPRRRPERRDGARSTSEELLNANRPGSSDSEQKEPKTERLKQVGAIAKLHSSLLGADYSGLGDGFGERYGRFAPGPDSIRWGEILQRYPYASPSLKSAVRGVAHGLPDWMERSMSNRTKRLAALGNAVVPDCAQWLGERIIELDRLLKGNCRIEKNGRLYTGRITGFDNGNLTLTVEFEGDPL